MNRRGLFAAVGSAVGAVALGPATLVIEYFTIDELLPGERITASGFEPKPDTVYIYKTRSVGFTSGRCFALGGGCPDEWSKTVDGRSFCLVCGRQRQ